ncbi:MAG: NAD(+)/NADH kinase [Gammaproteobacteria bacterium]|nr:NAD(+)/NADH kinase [Gammaproteobacteria bacterium]
MSAKFKTIGLVGTPDDERVAETLQSLAGHLKGRGTDVLVLGDDWGEKITAGVAVSRDELANRAELVMSVGGDGTMLFAVQLVATRGTPLVGINRGRLGFLADISPDELGVSIDAILDGEYLRETRAMLMAGLRSGTSGKNYALNDIVLQRAGDTRLIDIETRVNGTYLNTHSSDGLIIATPTGSTAYALSCGGPILEPSLNAVAIVPICPHTLSDRPIVIDGDSEITVRLIGRKGLSGQISCDGRPYADLHPGDELTVEVAPFGATLLHPKNYDYAKILRSKLAWGHSSRRSR